MDNGVDLFLAHVISKYGLIGLAVFGAVVLLSLRLGWVTFKMPVLRRKDDQAIEFLANIVKENTAAFVALKATMDDNKGITIKVADTLDQVHTALAGLSGHIQGALRFMEPSHRRDSHRAQGG
jgi:hypothetical protein